MRTVRSRQRLGRAERAWARLSRVEIALLLVVALALAGAWAVAADRDELPAYERSVFLAVNGWSEWYELPLRVVEQLGSVGGALVVAVVAGLVTRDPRLGGALVLAGQGAYWTAKLVKELVGRARPMGFLPDVELREAATGYGFASGHAAVAFALATVLVPVLPRRWRLPAIAAAALVALARVYAGVHLPLDVVGGAGLGVLLGTAVSWALVRPHRSRPPRRVPSGPAPAGEHGT
jgi:glycosyltransferase 2 family protein